MLGDESFVQLLSVLYAAPTDPRRWDEFLQQLCASCSVSKAALIVHDLAREDHRILARSGDEIKIGGHLYESHYWRFDEWTNGFFRQSSGKVILGEEVWPEPVLRKSVYYNDFLKKSDICELVGIPFKAVAGIFESISLYRGPREDRFGTEQISSLKRVAPHLKAALETRRRLFSLENRVSDLETALDCMQSALLLVDASGAVIFVNQRASSILAQSGALLIYKRSLIARSHRETASIRRLIERAIARRTDAVECGALPICREGKRPLLIFVAPVSTNDTVLPGKAAAAIFIDDPELQPMVVAEVLRALFGLTPAETRLALSVLDGHSVSESAERGGISRETAKTQMSAVLSKTGTRRQGELIRLLSRLPS